MVSTFSLLLRLELIATGDQSGVWGVTTNRNLGTLLEASIAGRLAYTHPNTSDPVLTTSSGLTDQARNMIIDITGTLTANRNLVCPTSSKLYIVRNGTTGGFSVTLKTAAGTGVEVPNGGVKFLFCDGTNVEDANLALQQAVDSLNLNAILRDGSVAAAANLPMGGFRHTGAGNAQARGDYTPAGQVQDQGVVFVPPANVGGVVNATTLTPTPAITAYAIGQKFAYIVEIAPTGAGTVDVSGVGAVAQTRPDGTALADGDLPVGSIAEITYDGTGFRVTNAIGVARLRGGNTFFANQTIRLADDGSAVGPNICLDRLSASPAAADDMGTLSFDGRDSAAGVQNYGTIIGSIVDPTNGAETGRVRVRTVVAGSFADRFSVSQGVWVGTTAGADRGPNSANAGSYHGSGSFLLPGHIAGLTLTRTGNRTLSLAVGSAVDSTNAEFLPSSTVVTLDLDVPGDFVNGGVLAADTWYHLLIGRDGTSYVRGLSPTISLPSGWDTFRRRISIRTDSSSNILAFTHLATTSTDDVILTDPLLVYNTTVGSPAVLPAVGPPGVRTKVRVTLQANSNRVAYVSTPDQTDVAVDQFNGVATQGLTPADAGAGVEQNRWVHTFDVWTDTSGQIRLRQNVNATLRVNLLGWTEGRF